MNTITIELCAEDRARIDAVIAALENRPNCEGCVKAAFEMTERAQAKAKTTKVEANKEETPTTTTSEAEAPAEAPADYPVDPPPFDVPEQDAPEQDAPEPDAPKVDRADVQRMVVELSAAGKKAEVKEIVMAYADRVSAIPEDKLAEVFEKLNTLEG